MPIEQVRFLGASIIQFNSVIGWNGQSSTVEVSLVEDIRNGDAFLPPSVGSPVLFIYEGFQFGGLLQNYTKSGSSAGSPLYTVTIIDPRSLLSGVKVILDGFFGSVAAIPNIVNPFGYYESSLFGSSGSNGSGMTWTNIRNALNATIALGSSNGYGGPISFMGFEYGLDLSNLPNLPDFYRISGHPSLMELIQEVCDAGGNDFFVELINGNITIFTISRINIPDQGVITNFVTQTPGAVSKNIGFDMVNNITGKFIVGGKKREMFYTQAGVGPDGKDNIWWFWGFDNNGNVVLGDGITDLNSDSHTFVLDSRDVLIQGVGTTYPSSMGEMRAALVSKEEWITFLQVNNNNQYVIDLSGTSFAQPIPISQGDIDSWNANPGQYFYPHNGIINPHFGKALKLGLLDNLNGNAVLQITNAQIANGSFPWGRIRMTFPGKIEDETERLYEMIRTMAEENYGVRFLVSLPSIAAAFDVENNRPIFSTIPVDAGYLDESLLSTALQSNLIPLDLNGITDDMNLYKPMMRFDNVGLYNFSQIPDDQMFYSADGNSIFIICSVDSEVLFLNFATLTQPRVVLRLPGRVTLANYSYSSQAVDAGYIKAIYDAGGNDVTNPEFQESLASQYPRNPIYEFATMPAVAVTPLESQIDKYGPWYNQGAIGAMDYDEDDTLVPWIYGTFANLELAGEALVSENIANLQSIESGTIEFPDVPNLQLGSQLLSTGPYVTNINVSIGNGGILTTYRMEMWKPKFGTLNRSIAETLKKMGRLYNTYRRNFLQQVKINRKIK